MKFLDVFNEIEKGNYALTDEAIYHSIQNNDDLIPLYGGNKEHNTTERRIAVSAKTKKGVPITVFSGEGIIISLDGSAGSMTYKSNEKFALNHHAGFITVKEGFEHIVHLEYFALFFQNFYRSIGVSDGSKTLSLEQIYSEEFALPQYDLQLNILHKLEKTRNNIQYFTKTRKQYIDLLNKQLLYPYKQYQSMNVRISECIDYMSGTSQLTEEKNYVRLSNDGDLYQLLTGSITKCTQQVKLTDGDPVKPFVNQEGLLVTRKGKAGLTRYLVPGKYVLNDDAYILLCREDSVYEINLKWLAIQYKESFLNFASSSDNGTWNMTGFFEHVRIDIPLIEEQEYVVSMYERVECRIEAVQTIENNFSELLNREIRIA